MRFLDLYSRFTDSMTALSMAWISGKQVSVQIRVVADAVELIQGGQTSTYFLRDVTDAYLYLSDMHTVIFLRFGSEAHLQLAMEDPQWPRLMTALDASAALAQPSHQWQLDWLARGADAEPLNLMSLGVAPTNKLSNNS